MPLKLPFGLKGERIVNIHEVGAGLKCDCRCPACLQPLVAKKGGRMVHHFAHHRGSDCGSGLETALHYQAKKILERRKRIVLPPVYLPNGVKPFFPACELQFDALWLERRMNRMVPDLVVRKGGKRLLIEIAVTHTCEEYKIRRIRQNGWAALEVDLLSLVDAMSREGTGLEEEAIEQRLVYETGHKRWLFNPKRNAVEMKIKRLADRKRVIHRLRKESHYYIVRPCPEKKRYWQQSALSPATYARVFQDCLHCPFCLEINYEKAYRAFREVNTRPLEVICWANISEQVNTWK